MIRYASIEDAKRAVHNWHGDPESITHIGNQGNSVFSFLDSDGNIQILRFTDPDFRSFGEMIAELNFVDYLHNSGVAVSRPLPASNGKVALLCESKSGELICSSISFAPGLEVQEGSPHWNRTFFKEWGRSLGQIHRAAKAFHVSEMQPDRWQWDSEILIANAERFIPPDDKQSLEEFRDVVDQCQRLTKSENNYGLIHADHAPQNFRYDPARNLITAFDFGNCCYHWFISDLAIALSTVRRKDNREEIRENLLTGYSEVTELPDHHTELIDLFIRLRVIYVYLSRLHLWARNRTQKQESDLKSI